MLAEVTALWRNRELLAAWTWRGIRSRYKQTLLGGLWAILQPLALMAVFSLVFSYLFKVPSDGIPYPIFSYAALLPWSLFAASVTAAVPSLVDQSALVSKIYFPREILPLGAIGVALVDFLLASTVFAGMMVVYQVPLTWQALWVLPLLLIQVCLAAGLGLAASAANVFYRDVRHVIALVLQLWMYATPVIYPLSLVPDWLRPAYLLNPMAGLVETYRRVLLLGQAPDAGQLAPAVLVSLAVLISGWALFRRLEGSFADVI